ncbi:MAG: hypothetical protein J6S13_01635 [Clostridia bacterium]|nr:hypothetical protein [Clostridia bacterium]
MSKKFRNSLFGFNRDDVMDFVVESREKEAKLKAKCDELNTSIDELNIKLADLEKTVADFKRREESLTRLSESIGRLYLVAQANAEAVTKAAEENATKATLCVESNMRIACEAESKLEEIGLELNKRTEKYLEDIELLKAQLSEAKNTIEENKSIIEEGLSEASKVGTKNNENS